MNRKIFLQEWLEKNLLKKKKKKHGSFNEKCDGGRQEANEFLGKNLFTGYF